MFDSSVEQYQCATMTLSLRLFEPAGLAAQSSIQSIKIPRLNCG